MRGEIKLRDRWLGFRAEQVLTPQVGFVWAARVAGVVTGSDQYVSGRGWMSWKVARLLTVLDAEGPDVSRSGAGRCAGETCWLPSMWLPRFGATWTEQTQDQLTVRTSHDGHEVFGLHPFGMEVTATDTYSGLTIPTEGRVGWFHGTPRWTEGEFFRFHITALQPVT